MFTPAISRLFDAPAQAWERLDLPGPAPMAGGVLRLDPAVLRRLAARAMRDVSFLLRPSWLAGLRAVALDADASANDRFVAGSLLRNAVVAAEGRLPLCQDTGTAAVLAWKGEAITTGGDDVGALSAGIAEAYRDLPLRHSVLVPVSMTGERRGSDNLPAQVEIHAAAGAQYRLAFLAKGGGSSNRGALFQETKRLLDERHLRAFLAERIPAIGVAGCPPYRLAVVIGGLSPEMALSTMKLASAGLLDGLPLEGGGEVQAFRDPEWEAVAMDLARASRWGAQYGGTAFALEARVVRLPRHAASCPVAVGVGCNADRAVKAVIDARGVFLERLEREPARYLDGIAAEGAAAVRVDLDQPVDRLRAALSGLAPGARLLLSGHLVVARDAAHQRILERLERGEPLPGYLKRHPVYYAGPSAAPPGAVCGSFGPTTSRRMDPYVEPFLAAGASPVMLGKGDRSPSVAGSCRRHGGFYLGAIGGAAALIARENVLSVEVLDLADLGMEAVRRIRVRDLPAFLVTDDRGRCLYDGLGGAVPSAP